MGYVTTVLPLFGLALMVLGFAIILFTLFYEVTVVEGKKEFDGYWGNSVRVLNLNWSPLKT
jgi:hypothetical protein